MSVTKHLRSTERALLKLDEGAHELTARAAGKLPGGPLHAFSKLGDQPQQRMIAGAVLVGGLLLGKERMTRAGARMILAHEAATAAKDQLKNQIDRHRPRSARTREQRKPTKGQNTSKEVTSFPSGHSAGAMATARAFSREYPEYAAAAIGAASLVAAAQVPRRAHYPTDILAGFVVGLLAEAGTSLAMRLLWCGQEQRGGATRPEERSNRRPRQR